jgi:3-isopropylmalate/(R)-2-methylmalate dehydratase small subunit
MKPALHFFPDNVDTDQIMPGQFLSLADPQELARHCMHGFDPGLASRISPGDIFIAGANFGCGSSREHAPLSIKTLGVHCVIATSFARIFYRNAINLGLPAVECPRAVAEVRPGDHLLASFEQGIIFNKTKKEEYRFAPFPAFIRRIIDADGIIHAFRNE